MIVLLNWDSQPFSLSPQRNFPISFKPKVAIAEFFWKMQKKTWNSIFGADAMPLSLKNLLLINVQTMSKVAQIFVAFSEQLNLTL